MQKPLEWRNMGYFQDMGLLFIYSLIVLLWKEPDRTLIFAILWAVILICGIYFIHGKSTKVLVCTVFALMALVVPEIEMFYPILIYALIKEINWQMGLAISMAGAILQGKYGNMHIEIMAKYVVGCLLAAILERKTYKYDKMDIELRKTVDSGEEKALLLSEKNKALAEKQNSEIYAATLRERNRIAREIHDNVGHVLSRTILLTGAVKAVNKDQNLAPMLDGLDDSLNSAMDSIRSSVHDLHDEAINLQEELKRIIRDFKYCKVELEYDVSDKMDSNAKYCYACVVKEALSNIMKYSGATYVKITVREHPALYQLCVEDNGRGGTENMDKNTGIGLKNMQDRVQALNGTLRIEGEKGFRIFAMIPKEMPKEKENN